LNDLIDQFINYIRIERGVSKNTIDAYSRDLRGFADFITEKGMGLNKVNIDILTEYVNRLSTKLSRRSLARSISAIRTFFKFLVLEGIIRDNPSRLLEIPKISKTLPSILNQHEIELLLNQPSPSTYMGVRDRAMLELLYASGLRVSELVSLRINDVNLDIGYVKVAGRFFSKKKCPTQANP